MDSWFGFGPLSDDTNNRAQERAGQRAGSREAMEVVRGLQIERKKKGGERI